MQEITDIHSHVLYGVDDGARNRQESLQMLSLAAEGGVRRLIATPHNSPWEKDRPTPEEIRSLCRDLQQACDQEIGVPIRLIPGQEQYWHRELPDELAAGEALPLGESDLVLVEFGLQVPAKELRLAASSLARGGYRMVVAHCERFEALRKEETLQELLSMGVLLQSNIGAVQGGLFDSTARWLRARYKRQEISFIGSDMHSLHSRPPVSQEQVRWFTRHLPADYAARVLDGNARERFFS